MIWNLGTNLEWMIFDAIFLYLKHRIISKKWARKSKYKENKPGQPAQSKQKHTSSTKANKIKCENEHKKSEKKTNNLDLSTSIKTSDEPKYDEETSSRSDD